MAKIEMTTLLSRRESSQRQYRVEWCDGSSISYHDHAFIADTMGFILTDWLTFDAIRRRTQFRNRIWGADADGFRQVFARYGECLFHLFDLSMTEEPMSAGW